MVASSRWPVKRRPVGDGHIAVAVPLQRLRVAGIGDDGVGRGESADEMIIPTGAVEVQARTAIPALTGETIGRLQGGLCPGSVARAPRRRK